MQQSADNFRVDGAGDMFPASYNLSIINAQHGSWDRTPPLGYRVMVLTLSEDGLAQNYSALADGWLQPNGTAWGEQLCLPCRPAVSFDCCLCSLCMRLHALAELRSQAAPWQSRVLKLHMHRLPGATVAVGKFLCAGIRIVCGLCVTSGEADDCNRSVC